MRLVGSLNLLTHLLAGEVHPDLERVREVLSSLDSLIDVGEVWRSERVPGDGLDDEGRVPGGGYEGRGGEVEHVLLEGDWGGGDCHGRLSG